MHEQHSEGMTKAAAIRQPQELIDWADLLCRCGGEEDVAVEIVQAWLEDNADLVERLAAAVQGIGPVAISECAHQLKGSAATIGATELAKAAYRLETTDESTGQDLIEAQFATLEHLCDQLTDLLGQDDWVTQVRP